MTSFQLQVKSLPPAFPSPHQATISLRAVPPLLFRHMAARRRGRGSAGASTMSLAVVLVCAAALLVLATSAEAGTTYVVGDGAGWTRHLETWWLAGKTFRAGDVLVFKYDREHHDVARVSKGGYRRCAVSPRGGRAPVLATGHDSVTLRRGTHYFICTKPGHCAAGMKLAVNAY